MGLLDDAIREHMELKRLRGADPSMVARQEQDALGPVPRGEGGEGQTTPEGDDPLTRPVPAHGPDFANVGQETAELDMRAVLEGDVLEGTPDFLRETPEQERLWFEQQPPPRDFDFDK